jgi:hypothetical protein
MENQLLNRTEPLDRLSVGNFQLLCLPNELRLTTIQVNPNQFLYYNEDKTAVFKQLDFNDLLHFLFQCCQILERKPIEAQHKVALSMTQCELVVRPEVTEIQIQSIVNQTFFQIDRPEIPVFISAITKLAFKTYCYSHSITFTINKYLITANLETIKNPTIETTFETFNHLNCITIDWYLLFDIVERHKKLLGYLKPLLIFNQCQ